MVKDDPRQGDPPSGAGVIEFPTAVGTIVGRWACDGPADLAAVQAACRCATT